MIDEFPIFCKKNKDRIIKAISLASKNIPPKMNLPDYRFQISNFFSYILHKEFYEDNILNNNLYYDMLYNNTFKIALKIQQEIFQKKLKNDGLSIPKEIVIKNCLGYNGIDKKDLDLDYLMAIQRGKDKGDRKIHIGFGIISKSKLISLIFFRKNDQIIAKIDNSDFDFYSGMCEVTLCDDQERKNKLDKIFLNGLSNVYDGILKIEN